MALEKIIVTTPGKHEVSVRLDQTADDVWDTTLVYADRVHRVGKFKGKNYVIEAATKKATEIADAPAASPQVAPTTRPAKKSAGDSTRKAKRNNYDGSFSP